MEKFINKILLRYFIFFFSFAFLGVLFLKFHYQKNYSQEKLEEILAPKSLWREVSDNPCKYQINGDPVYSESGYIKLNLYCLNGNKSLNTLSLVSIKTNLTYESTVTELAQINSFDKNLILNPTSNWKCDINGKKIEFKDQIIKNVVVNCYEDNK